MTFRQRLLKFFYPALMWLTRMMGRNTHSFTGSHPPPESFYQLKAMLNNGKTLEFESLKGKKVLIVNTASHCGYTGQYAELQKLSEAYADRLTVIGFPANDFKEQETGTDEEIASFCQVNYGVSFPLVKKSVTIRAPEQNPVYQWLTDPHKNGWNKKQPAWNFTKYLVDETGHLARYFGPSVSPLSAEVKEAVEA